MKKYTITLIFFLVCMFTSGCSFKKEHLDTLGTILKRDYIIVGVKSDSPPFGYYKDNNRAGIDIELSKRIVEQIFGEYSPEKIKYVDVTPQNRISKLNSQDVDILIATMSINEKRKLVISFSEPYYTTEIKLMVKKNSKITSINKIDAKERVAVVMGTTGEKIARTVAPNITLVGTKTYGEAFNYLRNSQVAAILGDEAILKGFLNNNYKIINRAYSREYYAVAARKQEDSKELLNKINVAVSMMLDEKKSIIKKI